MPKLMTLLISAPISSLRPAGRDLKFDGEPADRPERRHRGTLIVRRLGFAGLHDGARLVNLLDRENTTSDVWAGYRLSLGEE